MSGWMRHKLDSKFPGEISMTSDMQMTPLLWQKAKRNYRASWWKWKRIVKNIQKTKIMTSGSITSWQIDGETMDTVTDFIFLGSKVTADGDWSLEIWRNLVLERTLESLMNSKEIKPGLMLRLKLQYFGHLMWGTDLLEKTLNLGKIESRRRRGRQKMRCWDAIAS